MDATTIRVQKALQDIGTVELARRAGVSRFTAWRWQAGKDNVSPAAASRLQAALFEGAGTQAVPAKKSA